MVKYRCPKCYGGYLNPTEKSEIKTTFDYPACLCDSCGYLFVRDEIKQLRIYEELKEK